ncbi:hypothetical protein [Halalkalicoccus subterraneus]|uniref:hypothetical protein n=1 Tax=Halalkalicoccus subterraneus TaxID=2675002 RepID=UPI000EFC65CE|nr:hypothetical protein [Halalkalicoccus subterraneus]
MALKTALEHNPVLTVAFLLFGGWLAITTLNVASSMGPVMGADWIGHSGPGGVVGLAVMIALGVLLVYVYAELAESDPAPDSFPPER